MGANTNSIKQGSIKHNLHRRKWCCIAGSCFYQTASDLISLGRIVLLLSLCTIVFILPSNNASAGSSTISLNIDNNTASLNAVAASANGTFVKSDNVTLSAITDNATGYTLKIMGSSDDSDKLINTTDDTATINSITAATTEETFKSISATSYNGTWGYLPSKYCIGQANNTHECTANTSFLPAPTSTGDTLDVTTAPNATVNTYTLAIGARIDSSTKMGVYNNSYNVILVANAIPYSITYDDNVVGNMPIDTSGTTVNDGITVSSNTPTRKGYTFLGWCKGTVSTTNGTDSCSGTTLQPSANIAIDQTGGNNDSALIAMWQKQKSIDNLYYMQDFASLSPTDKTSVIDNMDIGSTHVLKDSRDNQGYIIAKLKDGNIWMVQNLRLGRYSTSLTLTSTDSNVNGNYVLDGKLDNTVFTYSTNNGYEYTNDNSQYYCTDSYGCYYNWYTATAGSGTSAIDQRGQNADYSICPAGWTLPTGGEGGDFSTLASAYNYDATLMLVDNPTTTTENTTGKAPGFTLGGYHDSNGARYVGSSGRYWSSTAASGQKSYHINFSTSDVSALVNNDKYFGRPIRCLIH